MNTREARLESRSTLTDSDYGTSDTWGNVEDPSAIYSIYRRAPCNSVLVTGGISAYNQATSLAPVDYNKLKLSLNYGDATEYASLATYGGVTPATPAVVTPATPATPAQLRASSGGNGISYYSPNQQTFSTWRTPY